MSQTGLRDLASMLAQLEPMLDPECYVFTSHAEACYGDHSELHPVASLMEPEGLTLVITRACAQRHGFDVTQPFQRIVLKVHSDLMAVGLTAAVARALAAAEIPANIMAGAFHDQVFVPADQGDRGVRVLQALADSAD